MNESLILPNRFAFKLAGESGQGINSIGELWAKSLKHLGYHIFAYREYPSLIKGGYAAHQIDISQTQVNSSSEYCQLLICLSRVSVHKYLSTLSHNGILFHNVPRLVLTAEEERLIDERHLHLHYFDTAAMIKQVGGTSVMENVLISGAVWKVLELPPEILLDELKIQLAKKPELIELNKKCFQAGYESDLADLPDIDLPTPKQNQGWEDSMVISGNQAVALGAISAGVRAYFGYPMTPSSAILNYLAETYKHTKMLVKQVEDEITAAEMVLGSMFMGTRALTATSGGGFDLMTETVSLAAMTETPFVCVIGQRPGPATGMPTWTAQGDLNLAIYSGHGEFPRAVLAASDIESAYLLIQEAFNIAERWQIPVLLLTDKQLGESLFNVDEFPAPLAIERGLVPTERLENLHPGDRYRITESGISPRWFPGQSSAYFVANSDEHRDDGTMVEDAEPAKAMMSKRMRKLDGLQAQLPEPVYYGDPEAKLVFVGWGSVKNTMLDVISLLPSFPAHEYPRIGYLHYEYIYPLRITELEKIAMNKFKKLVLIENNFTGQLGQLIRQTTGIEMESKLLKYDGRAFYVEDILRFLQSMNNY